MTKVKLHGALGEEVGNADWNLKVSSVKEAIHAINCMTNKRLSKIFLEKGKGNVKYRILINGEDFIAENKFNNDLTSAEALQKDIDNAANSELCIKKQIETIDIVPILEGADEVVMTVVGAILFVVGVVLTLTGNPLGPIFLAVGSALLAAGITAMLMEPPDFKQVREIEGMMSDSYLFNGPVNSIREGGAVPVVFGQLLAGSQVIAAYYDVDDTIAGESTLNT